MRFIVAVKQVPDTFLVSVDEDGNLDRKGVPSVLNPYCETALMTAVGMKGEGDEVIAVTMGPPQAESALRRCMELGADKAYLLTDPAFAGADVWATSRALNAFFCRYCCDADLFLFGRQTIDGDTGQVPAEVAQMMGVQQFYYVSEVVRDGDGFTVSQDYGDLLRRCRVPRGSVISMDSVDPNGHFPSATQFLDAMDREIVVLDRVALGLGLYSVGNKGSNTRIISTTTVNPSRRNRKVMIRDPSVAAGVLMDELGVSE